MPLDPRMQNKKYIDALVVEENSLRERFLQRDEERKPPQRIVSAKKNKIS
jgi:hypothetical protein